MSSDQQQGPAFHPPSMNQYLLLWFLLTAGMTYEYMVLNHVITGFSLIRWLHAHRVIMRGAKLSPEAGSALSFRLGWIGFLFILMTNLYVLRKRLVALQTKGQVPRWLDFHIFCGLIGPTIIIFHSNFKVGGLVAISFWSMMISFASGIVGRYFYMQLLELRQDTKRELAYYDEGFKQCQTLTSPPISDALMARYKNEALVLAGGTAWVMSGTANPLVALMSSMLGDVQLMFVLPQAPPGLSRQVRRHLKTWAVLRRKVATTGYFQRLMGYWHTFHIPFAVFMYVVVVIHIAAALIFRVHH